MGFDPANPSLKDVRIRQAVDHAIDRNAITQRLLRNMGTPVAQIVAPVSNGYDASLKPTSYDPELARKLVKESGYQGDKITLQYPNDFIVGADGVAQAVAGYLGTVGINVDLQGMEYSSFYALWQARKLNGMHLFVFGPILLDADVPIYSIFATSGQRGYIFDPRVDQLAAKQRAEVDPIKRRKLISDLFRASNEYQPFVYLYAEKLAAGMRDTVNWKVGPDGIVRLLDVSLNKK
jgi:peptide/nickel transport system substrate-binding protein